MLNLIAKLGLDSSAFARGLSGASDQAKKAGDTIGKEVGKDFTKAMKRTIGAGAIAGAVVSAMKDAQEVRDLARAFGVTNQEFAAMEIVSKKLGETTNVTVDEFERLTRLLIESGEIADDNVFDKLAESADKADSAIRKVKASSSRALAGVVSYTEAVGAFIGAAMVDANPSDKSTDSFSRRYFQGKQAFKDSLAGMNESEDIFSNVTRVDVEKVEKEKADKATKDPANRYTRPFGSLTTGADQFARIGLGNGQGQFNVQSQMLQELKQVNRNLMKTEQVISKKL